MSDNQLPQLTPKNLAEAIEFCKRLSETEFVPTNYRKKPGDILACIQFGAEVGIGPMQALQSIAVINGRPSLFGDVMLALVERSGLLAHHREYHEGDTAICEVQRKGEKDIHKVKFSQADAVKAKLSNKQGPWTDYPARMRMWRARGFALRDKFPDVLRGLISREEAMDIPTTAKKATCTHGVPLDAPYAAHVAHGDTCDITRDYDHASRSTQPSNKEPETVVVVSEVVNGAVVKEEVSPAGSESASKEVGSLPLSDASAAPRSGGEDRVLNEEEIAYVNQMLERLGLDYNDLGQVLMECSPDTGKPIKTLKFWPESKYQDLTERLRQMAAGNG